jgi:hypothetical protein
MATPVKPDYVSGRRAERKPSGSFGSLLGKQPPVVLSPVQDMQDIDPVASNAVEEKESG